MPTESETVIPSVKAPVKKRKLFKTPKFFNAPVKITKKTIGFELPAGILAHMEIPDGVIHWTIVNGVLQISGFQPQVTIPMLTSNEFQPQE